MQDMLTALLSLPTSHGVPAEFDTPIEVGSKGWLESAILPAAITTTGIASDLSRV